MPSPTRISASASRGSTCKARGRIPPTAVASAPTVPNEITDWSNPSSGPDNQLRVTVQGTVLSIDVGGFEGHQGEDSWYPILGVDLSSPPIVGFIFTRDMTGSGHPAPP